MTKVNKKNGMERGDNAFYYILMIWPLLQFAIFYVYVNFNSILFAFSKYQTDGTRLMSVSYLVDNIKLFVSSINVGGKNVLGSAVGTSILGWAISTGISVPIGLLFSYYIGRKMPLAGAFRIILFLPSVICIIVLVQTVRTFMGDAFRVMCKDFFGAEIGDLFANGSDTSFTALMTFKIWISFGTSVLMFSNAVSEISPETLEAGRIDGASSLAEFWHIVLPSVYPTLTVFLITSVANILLDQFDLFSFYGYNSSTINTVGYLMFVKSASANGSAGLYPPISAFGILLTAIAVPTTLLVKYCLEKFGPRED